MNSIRIVIVSMPTMLRDIVQRLAEGHVELDVIAQYRGRRGLAQRLSLLRPDLVLIGLHPGETDALIRQLIALIPTAKFIVFFGDGRHIEGIEMCLRRTDLAGQSRQALLDFVVSCRAPQSWPVVIDTGTVPE